MNTFFEKIKLFFSVPSQRNAILLASCALLAVGAGVGIAFGLDASAEPASSAVINNVPSASLTVDKNSSTSISSLAQSSTESSTSLMESSSTVEEEKEPVALHLEASSFTQDLNVNVLDDAGAIVRDVLFCMNVTGLDDHNSDYVKKFYLDALDGNLYISWIPEGNYLISLDDHKGFITPEPVEIFIEEYVVVYEKIEDISDQIVDEKDVNVSEDDNAYGSTGNENADTGTPPPTTTDTVTFVESSKKDVQQNITDSNGNVLYNYTYETGSNGRLLLTADNSESDVKPIVVNDVLSHGIRYLGSTINAADVLSASPMTLSLTNSALYAVQLSFRWDEADTAPPPPDTSVEPPVSDPPSSATDASSLDPDTTPSDPDTSTPDPDTTPSDPDTTPSDPDTSTPNPDTKPSAPDTGDTGSGSSPGQFTVSFVNPDGSMISSCQVTAGGTASPPASPTYTGNGFQYVFTGWSASYENVDRDLVITAVYDIYSAETVSLFNADNTPVSLYKITATPRTQNVTLYTGWQTINGKTYYYTADNKAVTGWHVIQGISYFFNTDGVRSDCMGIDVSRWNGNINWSQVKAAGIDFAIIRVGYRGYGTGALVEDPLARANLAGASAAGIKIGVYVFSQAINLEEAVQEASMALEIVKGYRLDYPIFIDSEYSTSAKDGRADSLSTAQRTAICEAFCKTIANSGYRTGVYASKSWFMYQLNVSSLEQYIIWLAHYTTATDYTRRFDMWQYTSTASVPGISGNVDMNFSYLNY